MLALLAKLAQWGSSHQVKKLALLAVKPPKYKKHKTIGVRVDDELHTIIEKIADQEEITVTTMTRKLVLEALKARKLIK